MWKYKTNNDIKSSTAVILAFVFYWLKVFLQSIKINFSLYLAKALSINRVKVQFSSLLIENTFLGSGSALYVDFLHK